MKLKVLITLFALILPIICFASSSTVASGIISSPCVIGSSAARSGFWTWPAGSQVNVYLREPDFSAQAFAAVATAVANWDAAAVDNGSHVHFSFHGATRELKTAPGDLTVIRGDVYDKHTKHLALLQAHSLHSNLLIDYAVIVVDLTVSTSAVLTNVMAHEIGHSLGLLDCYKCSRGTTAMGLLRTATETNGIEGPSACDNSAVAAAYRELALRVSSLPAAISVDEGEDPEADNTPLVKRPR
ncbi:MAG: hypothetical protein QOK48_1783 [Blastocatellia bacterium]|nr:hypothetical protein [Blastocatellia bacterium]